MCSINRQLEAVRATQTILQKLAEAAGDTWSMHFEDIVPKPYQEFKDIFTKESFDELPNKKCEGDTTTRPLLLSEIPGKVS